ncbi:MAG: asparagine synthase B [Planctomycetota bacterium]
MCSILALLDVPSGGVLGLRADALERSRRMRHRGPDWSGVYSDDRHLLVHERLAIVGVEGGAQPIVSADGQVALAVNGEIYNHRELESTVDHDFATGSDCEVILPLWRERGSSFLDDVNGIFAFVAVDRETGDWIVARDPIGVVPLYWGRDEHGVLHVASELKGIADVCREVAEFPPGHVWTSGSETPRRYHEPRWRDYAATEGVAPAPGMLRAAFEAAVTRQLMCDVPYGVLLSGGLDSSLVAACAVAHSRTRVESECGEEAWWPRVHSFAIGLDGSPDLAAARSAAEFLGTVHHELHFTLQEGLDALREVIWHLETYDVTTVRASTPMFLMARKIKATGVKMVLSGEGADEIFGGYLYFHRAPSAAEFHAETVRKLDQLHLFDCLRANKSMAAFGVEARVPFLDAEFLEVAMSFDAEHKRCADGRIEKHVLRAAFEGALPDDVLWRQKEQFSDGVGYAWIDSLRAHADANVTDGELERAVWRFPHNTPETKEAYLYREIFEGHYPGPHAAALVPGGKSIACSTPAALAWDASFAESADPSGRAVRGVHRDGY